MTNINFNFQIDPETMQKITEVFASIPAAFTELTPKAQQEIAGVFAGISLGYLKQQPAFARLLAQRVDAREADQVIAEIKAIGNYDAAQVGDINTAITFSQFASSSAATAEYIKAQVLAGVELQAVLDDVMGN